MLFLALMSVRDGTEDERIGRRAAWKVPDGMRILGEYWLMTPSPECVVVFEAEDVAGMLEFSGAWNDVYQVEVFPAMDAEEGLELAQMFAGSG